MSAAHNPVVKYTTLFIFTLMIFLTGCSDPVSSADLEASEIKFEGTVTPQWGDFYEINVKLSPMQNDYDYVLLTSVDTFYVEQDSTKKKMVNKGSSYSTTFSAQNQNLLDVVLYLGKQDQHLISTIDLPDRITSLDLDVSIDYWAKYSWIPSASDKFELNWFVKCNSDSTSGSLSKTQTINDSSGIAEWDLDSFLSQSKFKDGAFCNLSVKAIRSVYGEIDFNFAGGSLVSQQIDERSFGFNLK